MQDKNNPSAKRDHLTKIQKISDQNNNDQVSKNKLIKELKEYKIDLESKMREIKINSNLNVKIDKKESPAMARLLSSHIVDVELLITKIGTAQLKELLDKLHTNEAQLTESICKLKEHVTAKSKNVDSFKGMIDDFQKKIAPLLKT
jgi:hypothetical protein